jgi:single-strand DNA-binding protein
MDLNKAMIIGRLTRDPEVRSTPSGVNVCQVSIATGYAYNNQQTGQKVEQTEFHNVVMWRKLTYPSHH